MKNDISIIVFEHFEHIKQTTETIIETCGNEFVSPIKHLPIVYRGKNIWRKKTWNTNNQFEKKNSQANEIQKKNPEPSKKEMKPRYSM